MKRSHLAYTATASCFLGLALVIAVVGATKLTGKLVALERDGQGETIDASEVDLIPGDQLPRAKARSDGVASILTSLQSRNSRLRRTECTRTIEDHRRLVNRLVEIAEMPKDKYDSHDSRELAVELLGEFRSREALRALIRYADWQHSSPKMVSYRSFFDGYPCAKALQNFGPMARSAILDHVQRTPPADISSTAIEVYAIIAGTDQEALRAVSARIDRGAGYKEGFERLRQGQYDLRAGTARVFTGYAPAKDLTRSWGVDRGA